MSAIGPGMWVVRTDPRLDATDAPYFCEEVVKLIGPCGACGEVGVGMLLEDLPCSEPFTAWCVNHWRPIERDRPWIANLLNVDIDATAPRQPVRV